MKRLRCIFLHKKDFNRNKVVVVKDSKMAAQNRFIPLMQPNLRGKLGENLFKLIPPDSAVQRGSCSVCCKISKPKLCFNAGDFKAQDHHRARLDLKQSFCFKV